MKKKAVILVNLGTPEAPTSSAVAAFLKSFLSDPRVVEAPKVLWWFLLRLLIIPLRAKKVARAYQQIWWEEGSPLRVITERQVAGLQQQLSAEFADRAPLVTAAMTYGRPSLKETISTLLGQDIEQFLVLPMYPQYSGSTTGAIYDQLADLVKTARNVPDISVLKSFHDHPGYIDCLAASIRDSWQQHGRQEKLLMSFHGVPQEYVDKGDPYYQHCQETAQAVARRLELASDDWAMSFQSRFGPKKWLQPYTDMQLQTWAASGIRSVDIISPAFTADCLETLEELNSSYRESFITQGGAHYQYIPCLNSSETFIKTLSSLVAEKLFL
ncbi:ferrochelatase [Porticoccus sp.]